MVYIDHSRPRLRVLSAGLSQKSGTIWISLSCSRNEKVCANARAQSLLGSRYANINNLREPNFGLSSSQNRLCRPLRVLEKGGTQIPLAEAGLNHHDRLACVF